MGPEINRQLTAQALQTGHRAAIYLNLARNLMTINEARLALVEQGPQRDGHPFCLCPLVGGERFAEPRPLTYPHGFGYVTGHGP